MPLKRRDTGCNVFAKPNDVQWSSKHYDPKWSLECSQNIRSSRSSLWHKMLMYCLKKNESKKLNDRAKEEVFSVYRTDKKSVKLWKENLQKAIAFHDVTCAEIAKSTSSNIGLLENASEQVVSNAVSNGNHTNPSPPKTEESVRKLQNFQTESIHPSDGFLG